MKTSFSAHRFVLFFLNQKTFNVKYFIGATAFPPSLLYTSLRQNTTNNFLQLKRELNTFTSFCLERIANTVGSWGKNLTTLRRDVTLSRALRRFSRYVNDTYLRRSGTRYFWYINCSEASEENPVSSNQIPRRPSSVLHCLQGKPPERLGVQSSRRQWMS